MSESLLLVLTVNWSGLSAAGEGIGSDISGFTSTISIWSLSGSLRTGTGTVQVL